MISFILNVQKRQIDGLRVDFRGLPRAGGEEEEMEHDRFVLKLILVMDAQVCENRNNH